MSSACRNRMTTRLSGERNEADEAHRARPCAGGPTRSRRIVRSLLPLLDRRERRLDARVEVVAVERLRGARTRSTRSWSRVRISTNARCTPSALSSRSSCSSMPAAVTSTSVIASHTSTNHVGMPVVDQSADLVAERAGVGEEERRLPAVDDDIGNLGRGRERVDAVPPVHAVDAAEHCAVRPPAATEEHQHRQDDREDDALEHAEHDHADGSGQREQRARIAAPTRSGGERRGSAATARRRSPPRRAPTAGGRRATTGTARGA